MIYKLQRTIELKTDLQKAWDFFSDPAKLKQITPDWLNFKMREVPQQEIYAGMILQYQVQPILGIPVTWITEITHVNKPHVFVDEQRYGPYRMWHHQHHFKQTAQGVLVEDIVDYIMPAGYLGSLMHKLFIERKLKEIFDYRQRILGEHFGLLSKQD